MTYDQAIEHGIARALAGDELFIEALEQWCEGGTWYEPPHHLRDFQNVSEVSGYPASEAVIQILARAERKAK